MEERKLGTLAVFLVVCAVEVNLWQPGEALDIFWPTYGPRTSRTTEQPTSPPVRPTNVTTRSKCRELIIHTHALISSRLRETQKKKEQKEQEREREREREAGVWEIIVEREGDGKTASPLHSK